LAVKAATATKTAAAVSGGLLPAKTLFLAKEIILMNTKAKLAALLLLLLLLGVGGVVALRGTSPTIAPKKTDSIAAPKQTEQPVVKNVHETVIAAPEPAAVQPPTPPTPPAPLATI